MRCLSVADALAAQGADVEFVLSDSGPATIIEGRGYAARSLGTDWRDLSQGAAELVALCEAEEDPVALIDTYSITADYVASLAPFAKVCYLGSKGGDLGALSLVINYSTDIDEDFYFRTYGGRGTRFLFGAGYAPLRACFAESYRDRGGVIGRVLVTTGNTDPKGFLPAFLRAALGDERLHGVCFSAVVGGMAPDGVAAEVDRIAAEAPRVEVLRAVTDMAGLMGRCDAAVSANGTTVYELSAAGVPAFTFSMVEEQVKSAESLARLGAVGYCGLMGNGADAVADECTERLARLVSDRGRAAALAERAHGLIDGLGAEKIAKEIMSL